MIKKTFLEKLKELFDSKEKQEKQIQKIIDNPILLNKIYFKVLEMQANISSNTYIG